MVAPQLHLAVAELLDIFAKVLGRQLISLFGTRRIPIRKPTIAVDCDQRSAKLLVDIFVVVVLRACIESVVEANLGEHWLIFRNNDLGVRRCGSLAQHASRTPSSRRSVQYFMRLPFCLCRLWHVLHGVELLGHLSGNLELMANLESILVLPFLLGLKFRLLNSDPELSFGSPDWLLQLLEPFLQQVHSAAWPQQQVL